MKTKSEFLANLTERRKEIPHSLEVHIYLERCLEVIFDAAAELFQEIKNEANNRKRP